MTHLDALRYDGKKVVVTGCATGIGAATAGILRELGAEIHGLDVKPITHDVTRAIECDLARRASIDEAVEAIGDGPIHALFNVAGLPGDPFPPRDVSLVNFVGHRHLVERLLPRMPRGAAIASVTTYVGLPLRAHDEVMSLLDTPDFDAAQRWLEDRLAEGNEAVANSYSFSKECLLAYTLGRAREFGLAHGVRINAVGPGPTETPLFDTFSKAAGGEIVLRKVVNGFLERVAQPVDPAWPLVFLNSDAASFVSGSHLYVDAGFNGAVAIGAHRIGEMPDDIKKSLARA